MSVVAATWSALGALAFGVGLTVVIAVALCGFAWLLCMFCPHGGSYGVVGRSQWERRQRAKQDEREAERAHEERMEKIRLGLLVDEGKP